MSSPELVDEKILSRLCGQVKKEKWATTYLFTGKELARKRGLAIAFAKALNCLTPLLSSPLRQRTDSSEFWRKGGERNKVGGCACISCKKIESGTHPDVKWYGTDEEASSIKISEVRDFRNWLNLKPFEAKVKVFIFDQAERLTSEAQNALLKSIEEPPPGNVIIFLVPTSKSLFDTIASRSTEIKVPPFSSKAIRKILIHEGINEGEAEFLARMSQGELSLAREAHEEKWFGEKNQWIDALKKDPVSFLDGFHSASRDEISEVFAFLIEWVRDLLIFQASEDGENVIHCDRIPLIKSIVSRHDFESILELFESINQLKKSLDDYANQKLVLTQAEVLFDRFFKT